MPETATDKYLVLEELKIPGPDEPCLLPCWSFAIARPDPGEVLAWLFRLDHEVPLARGYLDSVRQRCAQWQSLRRLPDPPRVVFCEGLEDPVSLLVFMPDGESLPDYLARVPSLSERTSHRLAAEIVAWLASLVGAPRILANLELRDFFVHARDGIVPTVAFCPAFALLREESPRSDYQIARDWLERLSGLHTYLKQGRKDALGTSPPGENRAFRPFFKRLESGRDCPLSERFAEVETLFRAEEETPGKGEEIVEAPLESRSFPLGPLAAMLRRRASESDPDRYHSAANEDASFTAFRVDTATKPGDPPRVAHLLPPEAWFETSLVDPLNRRLSHPFLKAHHNCLRIRSVYCDESLTLLNGDMSSGIPLPSLLGTRNGIAAADLFLVAGKLHRALAQFDSADYDPDLVSPWQVELHLESSVASPGWEKLLASDIASWPPWEVVLRVERPAEAFLPGSTTATWNWARASLDGKFFPALVAWMLDWKRFQWAERAGKLAAEPLSWDGRLVALFQAAAQHLDPARTQQREKFLTLIEEGLVSE